MARHRFGFLLVLVLALGVGGCTGGGSGASRDAVTTSLTSSSCDNSLLAHHLGLAGGAVHELIWKPFSAGKLQESAAGRQQTLGTAARAGALAGQQLGKAAELVARCPSAAPLGEQLRSASAQASAVGQGLAAGTVDPTTLKDLDAAVTTIESRSAALGIDVIERTPTTSELIAVASALHT